MIDHYSHSQGIMNYIFVQIAGMYNYRKMFFLNMCCNQFVMFLNIVEN